MKAAKAYWFGRKRFGFGFGPRTWQGWTATVAYAALMVGLAQIFGAAGDHTLRTLSMAALTIAFLFLFFWKLDTSRR
jgi:hypothetical protein